MKTSWGIETLWSGVRALKDNILSREVNIFVEEIRGLRVKEAEIQDCSEMTSQEEDEDF